MCNLLSRISKNCSLILLSLYLISLYVLVLCWSAFGFALSSKVIVNNSFLITIFSIIIITIVAYYYQYQKIVSTKYIFTNLFIFLSLIVTLILISTAFWDNSYDGQTYHLQGINELNKGWNPFKESLDKSIPNSVFINHYAKSFEIFGSSIVKLTGDFETAKLSNLILLVAAWALSIAYFKTIFQNSILKSNIYAILVVFNPIVSTQIFTHLFDCQVGLLFIILLCSFLFYLQKKQWSILFWILSIIILTGLKFTGLVYVSLLIFGACLYLFLMVNKRNAYYWSGITFITILCSVCFLSYNPYITNINSGNHIFYPLMGKNKVNIMIGTNSPRSFERKNRFEKFILANTASSSNIHGALIAPEPKFKYPYKVEVKEWLVFKSAGVLFGGFGPLFFAILILSCALLVYFICSTYNYKKELIYLLALMGSSVFINPECWLPRYVPQLWLFPIIVIITFDIQNKKKWLTRLLQKFTASLIVVNSMCILMISILSNIIITQQQKNEYAWISKTDAKVKVISNTFISNTFRLNKYGISYQEIKQEDSSLRASSLVFKPISSSAVILLPKNTPPYHASGFFKYLESKIKKGNE